MGQPGISTDEMKRHAEGLEKAMVDAMGAYIQEHPEAENAHLTLTVCLLVAGRIGLTFLGEDETVKRFDTVAELVRKHGKLTADLN